MDFHREVRFEERGLVLCTLWGERHLTWNDVVSVSVVIDQTNRLGAPRFIVIRTAAGVFTLAEHSFVQGKELEDAFGRRFMLKKVQIGSIETVFMMALVALTIFVENTAHDHMVEFFVGIIFIGFIGLRPWRRWIWFC